MPLPRLDAAQPMHVPLPPPVAQTLQALRARLKPILSRGLRMGRELHRNDALIDQTSAGDLTDGGGPFVLRYVGRQRFVHDFMPFFARREAAAQQQGTHPEAPPPRYVEQVSQTSLHLPSFLLRRLQCTEASADVDLLVVDQFMGAAQMQQHPDLYAPFMNAYLPVAPTLEAQLALIRSKGHRRKLQSVLKKPLTWRKTQSVADFDLWYDTMYTPFVKDRFRFDAAIVPRQEMLAMYTKRGFLLLLEESGQPVSGAFLYTSRSMPGSLNYWKYALLNSDTLPPNEFGERNAKTEAMVLSHAVAEGYAELDFGLTRALPKDGIFIHKKRIGCEFRIPDGAPRFALFYNPKAQARFLTQFPLILKVQGQLQAWAGLQGPLTAASSLGLKDSLSACAFASLQGVRLFAHDLGDTQDKVHSLVKQLEAELGSSIEQTNLGT
jgi:hypothetical protein